jgi:hypothetical protein
MGEQRSGRHPGEGYHYEDKLIPSRSRKPSDLMEFPISGYDDIQFDPASFTF